MNIFLTATGKEFPCNFFGIASAGVVIADLDVDLITAAKVFSNKSETEEIHYIYDNNGEEADRVVKGFTSLLSVSNLYGETIGVRVMLQRQFADMEG